MKIADVRVIQADIPVERYLSREFHELEKERLWSRVWQFACREEVLAELWPDLTKISADLARPNEWIRWLAVGGIGLATINMFGGFAVTRRMLEMFRK